MTITVKQRGGYAGGTIELAAVDVDRLDPTRAAALKGAVQAAGFFGLPASLSSQAVGADLLTYEITIEDGGRRHTVSFVDDDSAAAAPLRRLRDAALQSR